MLYLFFVFHFQFSQDEGLKEKLFSTYPKLLVEASPYDAIWGIGHDETDLDAFNKETWRGLNLLGYILTEVRDELMCKEKLIQETQVC